MGEYEVDIGTNGSSEVVLLKSLTYGDWKKISRLIAPAQIKEGEKPVISFDAAVRFNEELIKSSIISPDILKTDQGLEKLSKTGFDKLISKISEMNNMSPERETNLSGASAVG